MTIPIEQFGRDHWSLLAYVDCCCVEQEPLDKRRLRCNENKHPLHAVNLFYGSPSWSLRWGTRLRGCPAGGDPSGNLQLPAHDDWDALDDLEAAGLVEIMSEAIGWVRLTQEGNRVAAVIRRHKGAGGSFGNFSLSAAIPAEL